MEREPSGVPFLEINNILTQLKCLQLGKKAAKPLFRQADKIAWRMTYDEGRAPHPVGTHGMIPLCNLWTLPAVVRRA